MSKEIESKSWVQTFFTNPQNLVVDNKSKIGLKATKGFEDKKHIAARIVAVTLSVIAGILTLGVIHAAFFLTKHYPASIEKEVNDVKTAVNKVGFKQSDPLISNANKEEIDITSPREKKAFQELAAYITNKYPEFKIEKYTSVKDLQKAGFPFHFALSQKDFKLLSLLIKAGQANRF